MVSDQPVTTPSTSFLINSRTLLACSDPPPTQGSAHPSSALSGRWQATSFMLTCAHSNDSSSNNRPRVQSGHFSFQFDTVKHGTCVCLHIVVVRVFVVAHRVAVGCGGSRCAAKKFVVCSTLDAIFLGVLLTWVRVQRFYLYTCSSHSASTNKGRLGYVTNSTNPLRFFRQLEDADGVRRPFPLQWWSADPISGPLGSVASYLIYADVDSFR